MNFVWDDLTMFYDIHGAGTPVLMLHGSTLDRRSMIGDGTGLWKHVG